MYDSPASPAGAGAATVGAATLAVTGVSIWPLIALSIALVCTGVLLLLMQRRASKLA